MKTDENESNFKAQAYSRGSRPHTRGGHGCFRWRLGRPAYLPAWIMVNASQIHEGSSLCRRCILHKSADVAREFRGLQHWCKNDGSVTVDLTVGDVVSDHKPETMPGKTT